MWRVLVTVMWGSAAMAAPVDSYDWRFVTDQVMGGVSTGSALMVDGALHMTGQVSTANNGGFIQVRTGFAGAGQGVRLRVQGDGQLYYVHLRSSDATRPWHYYRATFTATPDWVTFDLPWSAFEPSNAVLPDTLDPAKVTSIGIVAYGRDHTADLRVAEIGTY